MSANTAVGSWMSSRERARAAPRRGSGARAGTPSRSTSARRQGTKAAAASRPSARSRPRSRPSRGERGRLQPQQREQLVHARRDGELLGGDAVEAALEEQLAEPLLHAGPVALHLVLGVDLLAPQALAGRARLGPQRGAQRLRQAVRRVGRDHQRAQAGGGTRARRGGGDRRLPDAALARVEDRPGRHDFRESRRSRVMPNRRVRVGVTARFGQVRADHGLSGKGLIAMHRAEDRVQECGHAPRRHAHGGGYCRVRQARAVARPIPTRCSRRRSAASTRSRAVTSI